MQNRRHERVRELLKRELSAIILREFSVAEIGLVNVNDVVVANDLHSAVVFISIVGTIEQQKKALDVLQHHRKRIQGLVAHAVILKYTPALRFVVDDTMQRGNRVLRILEDIEATTPPDPS